MFCVLIFFLFHFHLYCVILYSDCISCCRMMFCIINHLLVSYTIAVPMHCKQLFHAWSLLYHICMFSFFSDAMIFSQTLKGSTQLIFMHVSSQRYLGQNVSLFHYLKRRQLVQTTDILCICLESGLCTLDGCFFLVAGHVQCVFLKIQERDLRPF